MNTPIVKIITLLNPLINNRHFQVFFWAAASGLIVLITSLLMLNYGPVNSMEYALLDVKMRYKTQFYDHPSMAPSPDIVILGVDSNTDKYIRLHPEENLNITIPRAKLAKVVDYLNRQGVKGILFDLEFKDVKRGDAELAQAIAKTPYVYAATRMDNTLEPFTKDQMQPLSMGQRHYPLRVFLEKGVFIPYLHYLAEVRSRFMTVKTVSPLDLGLLPLIEAPAEDSIQAAYPLLAEQSQLINQQSSPHKALLGNYSVSPGPNYRYEPYGDVIERAFSELCLKDNYQHYYQNNPKFLAFLEQKRLLLALDQTIPEAMNRKMTYCYTFPVIAPLMPHLNSIGVPSIDYDEDAYLRSITALYKGYQGNYYTYLGIVPVIDFLNVRQVGYTPAALYLDGREIPLREGENVFVNWKNPRLLVQNILKERGINPMTLPAIDQALGKVSAGKNNPMLNGGHIYRQISMIDALLLAEGKPLDRDAKARMHNIPFFPQSGEFSFKNKIVIIGNTLTDVHRTPISNTTFGPEVVAATLDMFLHDHVFIKEAHAGFQWGAIVLLAGLIAASVIAFANLPIGFATGILLIIIYWVFNLVAFVYWGIWIELILPSFTLGFSLVSATLYRYYVHDQEKHHLTNVFSNYVSPQIMSEIVKNPARAMHNLKGGKKDLTVLFSDLQGFTLQFENADPELMVSQLNEYFDAMTDIILAHGGTYDKYMGDSIMAFFGAPADLPEHAKMACKAAVAMQNALQALNVNWAESQSKILSHGIGISSGEMFVGNFGSRKIKNFTVMGSNVNLGARLEAYTRVAHWPIIISEKTLKHCDVGVEVKNLGLINVKGFTESVQIYGLEAVDGVPILLNHLGLPPEGGTNA